ncbi:MAG: hypothetical protein HZC44_11850 [Geobacter sp.]|nr:hypothetical protein [Geobacter sp.]
MNFRPDPSLSHVAIDEPSLYEAYRSVKSGMPLDKGISPNECEAYICSSKENGKQMLYIAFWEVSKKISHVFIPGKQPCSMAEYQKCFEQAQHFVASQGFTLEQIKLDYSTAMRQVIWGTIKVFKAPKEGAKSSAAPAPHRPALEVVKPAVKPSSPSSEAQTAQQVSSTPPAAASVSKVIDLPAPAKAPSGSTDTALDAATAPAAEKQEAVRDKPQLPDVQVAPLQQRITILETELADSRSIVADLNERIKALQDQFDADLKARDEEKSLLQSELQLSTERIDSISRQHEEKLSSESTGLGQRIEALTDELAELRDQLAAKAAETIGAEKMREQVQRTLDATQEEYQLFQVSHAEEIAIMTEELTLLQEKVAELEEVASQEREVAERSSLELEQTMDAVRQMRIDAEKEREQARIDKEQVERVAAAALNSARAERKELMTMIEELEQENSRLKEEIESEITAAGIREEQALAETARLRHEMLVREEVTIREFAGMRAELRRLVEERATGAGCPLVETYSVPQEEEASPGEVADPSEEISYSVVQDTCESITVAPTEEDSAAIFEPIPEVGSELFPELGNVIFPEMGASAGSEFYGSDGQSATEFRPDRSLSAVPCPAPEAIIALYESANKIQTVPDGFSIQKSGGFIYAIRRNGKAEVYLVWQMLESNQALIYTPLQQPSDEDEFQKVLQDALFYFESVGFMMAPVDLSAPKSRTSALTRSPFLNNAVGF